MDLTQTNLTVLDLQQNVENRQRLCAMKTQIEKQIDEETGVIKNEMAARGIEALDVADFNVTLSVRDRKTLDRTLLIEAGVSTNVIEACMKTATYLQLDVRKAR